MKPAISAAAIRDRLAAEAPESVGEWRALRREWSRALSTEAPRKVIELAVALLDAGPWGRFTAYELVANHRGAMASLTSASIRALAEGVEGWAPVDTFACYVAGPAWREGRIPTSVLHRWVRSPDRWLRRVAVASTVALNVRARGGRGDAARTLDICRRVVADRDDMVVKALSWALRSLIEWDRGAVERFLAVHGDKTAPRVIREVRTKLRTGLKNPRRGA